LSFARELDSNAALAEKIAVISERFLGAAYGISPLGEGYGIDSDPLIRFDVFDCTTFVETVAALALTENDSQEQTLAILNQIRYSNGQPSILTRNHFTSLDWISNNVKKGLIEDITRKVFPQESITIQTAIDKKAWFQKNYKIKFGKALENAELDMIRIQDIIKNEALLRKIPSGTIVNFVMSNTSLKEKIGTDLDIGHQGILIWDNETLLLRHARSVQYGVVEESFLDYLVSTSAGKYGINLVQLKQK